MSEKSAAERVIPFSRAKALRQELARRGTRVVFTNGCFDLLHVGHIRYLEKARSLGDTLWVGINSDASVQALKGPSRPVNPEAARAEVVAALEAVDYVTIFENPRATALLEELTPDLYAKGGDYTPATLNAEEKAVLDRVGSQIEIIPFVAGFSTTGTLARLEDSQ